MKIPFPEYHLLNCLNQYDQQSLPLDQFLNVYFRSNKAIGSKDRGFIAEAVYGLTRWLGLIDHLICQPHTWERRYQRYKTLNTTAALDDPSIPAHLRVSFPLELYQRIEHSFPDQTVSICLECNRQAPTTVRVNPLKIERSFLLERWHSLDVIPTTYSPYGITFPKKLALFSLPEFKEGLFEVQDEGSQLLALLAGIQPGEKVLDFCAGSGGKTLAFAHLTQGKGQIYLHDIRQYALEQARKRLKRAGIQNSQCLLANSPSLEKLKKKMDWVFVDAPCSGTGTLRRNPDMKWKFNSDMLQRLLGKQRTIFEKALSFVAPGGKIVYATCSILSEENEQQVEHFLRTYPIKLDGEIFKSVPKENGMDGFFGVTFKTQLAT